MKLNLNSLNKLHNPEKYTNLLDSLTKNRKLLEKHISDYSEVKEYDKILNRYEENKEIVEMFKEFTHGHYLLMQDILEVVRKHQDNFIKNSNVKAVCNKLKIENNFIAEDSHIKNINEIYAKVQENSNIIVIFELSKKNSFILRLKIHFSTLNVIHITTWEQKRYI